MPTLMSLLLLGHECGFILASAILLLIFGCIEGNKAQFMGRLSGASCFRKAQDFDLPRQISMGGSAYWVRALSRGRGPFSGWAVPDRLDVLAQ